MRIRVPALAIAVTLVAWPVGAAQESQGSLAEAAAKEKERRKAKKPAKTFTEEDLRRAGGGRANIIESPEPDSETPAAEAKTEPSGSPSETAKSDAELRAEKQTELQKRIDTEKKVIAAVRKDVDAAQRELNDLSNYTLGARREALVKVVEDGQKEIAKAEQTIADIEEEARRQGISVSP